MNVNSNCSRIDAVKASANQLKLQTTQAPRSKDKTESYQKAQAQIMDVETQVKTGDVQKAETALASASTALKELQTQPASSSSRLDVYA